MVPNKPVKQPGPAGTPKGALWFNRWTTHPMRGNGKDDNEVHIDTPGISRPAGKRRTMKNPGKMLRGVARILAFPVLFLTFATSAAADIYKWTDEDGNVHYSDSKPHDQPAEKIVVEVDSYQSVSYAPAKVDIGKRVIMYSASWCGYCTKARRYFRRKNIPFTEYDIEKSAKANRQFQKLGGQGVPVILVGNQRMNGFSEAGFNRIYQP